MFCSCSTKSFWFICFLSFFPRGLLLLFEGFLCEKQRGKKEEEVEERKEFCGVKKEAGGGR